MRRKFILWPGNSSPTFTGIQLTGAAVTGLNHANATANGFFFDTAVNNYTPFIRGYANIDIRAWDGSAYNPAIRVTGAGSLCVTFSGIYSGSAQNSNPVQSTSTTPAFGLYETGAGADEKGWNIKASGGVFAISTANDAGNSGGDFFSVTRSGANISTVRFGGNGVGSFLFGTYTNSNNGKIQIGTHTTNAGGIGFGTDVTLYRSAADTLKTDDALVAASLTLTTDLAITEGGTGASSASAARVNLLPAYAGNGSKVLALNSGATDVEWVTAGSSFDPASPGPIGGTTPNTAVFTTLRSSGNTFLATANTNTDPVASRANGLCVTSAAIYMRNGSTMKWGLSGNGDHVLFYSDNGSAAVQGGGINTTGSTTSFNATSDARLKTNVREIANSGNIIDAIRPVLHDWKTGEKDSYGFIAQDLYKVFPKAVTPGDNGETVVKAWAVDQSKLIPVLVDQIQKLRLRVNALEEAQ